ncbi:hypothetical protein Pelo_19091 [Pelomyxa schiedti]|nr:hypothetical protein Pelo_19091 [Pelomyxa schiedti]
MSSWQRELCGRYTFLLLRQWYGREDIYPRKLAQKRLNRTLRLQAAISEGLSKADPEAHHEGSTDTEVFCLKLKSRPDIYPNMRFDTAAFLTTERNASNFWKNLMHNLLNQREKSALLDLAAENVLGPAAVPDPGGKSPSEA